MTNDEGREPKGRRRRSPKLAQAPLRRRREWPESVFPFSASCDRARLLRVSRWTWEPGKRNVSVARLTECAIARLQARLQP